MTNTKKIAIALLICIFVTGLIVVIVYLVFKKDNNEAENPDNVVQTGVTVVPTPPAQSDYLSMQALIEQAAAGSIKTKRDIYTLTPNYVASKIGTNQFDLQCYSESTPDDYLNKVGVTQDTSNIYSIDFYCKSGKMASIPLKTPSTLLVKNTITSTSGFNEMDIYSFNTTNGIQFYDGNSIPRLLIGGKSSIYNSNIKCKNNTIPGQITGITANYDSEIGQITSVHCADKPMVFL